jgi:ankyrin repeat protein
LELNDYQIDKIATDSDLKKNYLHNRIIADQHSDDLTKKEYYLFSVKQKESYYNNMNENKKLDKAIKFGDLDFYKYLVEEKGAKIGDDAVEKAAETGNLELVTYLVEKGAKIGDDAVEYAAKTGNLELVEYLVKNGAKIGDDAVSGAVRNRKSNVVKYLVRIGAKITDHDAMIDYLKSVEENELIIKQLGLEKD